MEFERRPVCQALAGPTAFVEMIVDRELENLTGSWAAGMVEIVLCDASSWKQLI